MQPRVVALIPVRYDSQRFPGKVLSSILGRPILEMLLLRLSRLTSLSDVLVCTTARAIDSPIRDFCRDRQIPLYADPGPVDDVLGRFRRGADIAKAGIVIRANADSPFLSPVLNGLALGQLLETGTHVITGKTRFTGIPPGLCGDILTAEALLFLDESVDTAEHREHVTSAVFSGEVPLRWQPLALPGGIESSFSRSFTVDKPEDVAELEHKFIYSQTVSPLKWEPGIAGLGV